jgi:hypothetical protein
MRRLALSLFAVVSLTSFDARADEPWSPLLANIERLPGSAREISRWTSASRDVPLLEGAYGPQAQSSLGLELGTMRIHGAGLSARLGVHFLAAFENYDASETQQLPLVATQLYRGMYGSSLAFTNEGLNKKLGPRGAFEITILYGHEVANMSSSFADAHPAFRAQLARGEIPNGGAGDFIQTDYGLRLALGPDWTWIARAQDRVYLRGPFTHVPGVELSLRWAVMAQLQPLLSIYAEHGFGDRDENRAGDTNFFRAMLGFAAPGKIGIGTPFVSIDAGNGKGMLVNRRETHVSVGLRYTPF